MTAARAVTDSLTSDSPLDLVCACLPVTFLKCSNADSQNVVLLFDRQVYQSIIKFILHKDINIPVFVHHKR